MDDNESLYGDGGGQMAASETAEQEGAEAKTALINSDICPGMKPGDTFTVRIERVLDSGEYEVSYPGEEKGETETAEQPPSDSEMASYMS